ncbi:MAG: DUF2752 domain-containing protein [Phycisphaerae bacterium]|nr:DUF2752 domain-containing protein [Phycisphaerae bacterium]
MSTAIARASSGLINPPTLLDRTIASFVAGALLALLSVAAWLTPSPRGYGTHEQLALRSGGGLQTCTWVALTGKPCPTCGMTTAFAHAANGDFIAAAKAQPMGTILAIASATGFWFALHVAVAGSNAGMILSGWLGKRALWASLALLAASWVYKIATWQTP